MVLLLKIGYKCSNDEIGSKKKMNDFNYDKTRDAVKYGKNENKTAAINLINPDDDIFKKKWEFVVKFWSNV